MDWELERDRVDLKKLGPKNSDSSKLHNHFLKKNNVLSIITLLPPYKIAKDYVNSNVRDVVFDPAVNIMRKFWTVPLQNNEAEVTTDVRENEIRNIGEDLNEVHKNFMNRNFEIPDTNQKLDLN